MPSVVTFQDWEFLVESQATRQGYERVAEGGAEACGCAYCRNYLAVRHQVFPSQALDLLSQLGIDPTKEAEIYTLPGRLPDGQFHYLGWFHFRGQILRGPKEGAPGVPQTAVAPGFTIGFIEGRNQARLPEAASLVELLFRAEVPWVLEEEPPEWEE